MENKQLKKFAYETKLERNHFEHQDENEKIMQ
jgi:hypothetical protein